jgi:hypothetical protein
MLSLVVAGAAGRSATPATGRPAAAPTRTSEVIDFPVGSWRRLPLSPPVRLEIPATGVSSPLVRLGLNPDGTMQVSGDLQVESLASYPKRSLPDWAVHGATTAPALRLITCAGSFDRERHSYRDNLVVSAVRVADGHGAARAGR